MKRILTLFLSFTLLIVISGCNSSTKTNTLIDSDPVVINLPSDNTINGYRDVTVPEEPSPSESGDKTPSAKDEITNGYCGNKNSKVFHKASCASAKKMKDENKVSDKSREYFIENGYTPCKRCNP